MDGFVSHTGPDIVISYSLSCLYLVLSFEAGKHSFTWCRTNVEKKKGGCTFVPQYIANLARRVRIRKSPLFVQFVPTFKHYIVHPRFKDFRTFLCFISLN